MDRKTSTMPNPNGAVNMIQTIQWILGQFVLAKMKRPMGMKALPNMLGDNLASGGALWAPFVIAASAARLDLLLSGIV